jgi:hypothetical protein
MVLFAGFSHPSPGGTSGIGWVWLNCCGLHNTEMILPWLSSRAVTRRRKMRRETMRWKDEEEEEEGGEWGGQRRD